MTTRVFSAYRRPIETVLYFKYLGMVLLATDDYWPAMIHNLVMARTVWRRMLRILSREGVKMWVSGSFFKSIVQLVLLFGAEAWFINPRMGRGLGGFQD